MSGKIKEVYKIYLIVELVGFKHEGFAAFICFGFAFFFLQITVKSC